MTVRRRDDHWPSAWSNTYRFAPAPQMHADGAGWLWLQMRLRLWLRLNAKTRWVGRVSWRDLFPRSAILPTDWLRWDESECGSCWFFFLNFCGGIVHWFLLTFAPILKVSRDLFRCSWWRILSLVTCRINVRIFWLHTASNVGMAFFKSFWLFIFFTFSLQTHPSVLRISRIQNLLGIS